MQFGKKGANRMQVDVTAQAVVAIVTGILILIIPRLVNYFVAIYLIIIRCADAAGALS